MKLEIHSRTKKGAGQEKKMMKKQGFKVSTTKYKRLGKTLYIVTGKK